MILSRKSMPTVIIYLVDGFLLGWMGFRSRKIEYYFAIKIGDADSLIALLIDVVTIMDLLLFFHILLVIWIIPRL